MDLIRVLNGFKNAAELAKEFTGNLGDYEWHCDNCGAILQFQPGFSAGCGEWECTECGYENLIDMANIVTDELEDDFLKSEYDSMNEYRKAKKEEELEKDIELFNEK